MSVKEIRATLGNIDRSQLVRKLRNFCGLTPTGFRRHLNMSQAHDSTHYAPEMSKFGHNFILYLASR